MMTAALIEIVMVMMMMMWTRKLLTMTIRNRAKALKKKESTRPDEATAARKADQEPVFPQVLPTKKAAWRKKIWIISTLDSTKHICL